MFNQYKEDYVMVSHGGNGVLPYKKMLIIIMKIMNQIALMNLLLLLVKQKVMICPAPGFAAGSGMVPSIRYDYAIMWSQTNQ